MKIFFNSTFKEIERDASDLWVKGNSGNRLEAYFEELDLTNSNINARLTIEWGNGKTTTEIPMNKSFGFKYVYLTLPTLLESGEVKFTIGIYQNDTLLQTAIFTRKIKESVEASDKVPIDATEYEALMNLIEDLNNNREISLTNIDGKPTLLSKEKLDLVSYESVNNALDKMIKELTRLNDNNLFDPTGLENVYRYDLQFIDGFLQLKENGTIINQYNLTTFVADKTNHLAQSINELISQDSNFTKQLVDIRARLIAIEATGGGGTGAGTGGSVDLSQYYTKEQIDFTISGINGILESIPETYATNVGVANLEIELTKRIIALEEAESGGTIDLSGYLEKPADACTENTQILIGNTNGTLEYSTLTVKEINNRLENLESNSGGSSETTKSNVVKIFGGESNISDFANFDATKGGFILFYGILENEEYDGRFQMLVPLTQEFINGTDSANGLDTFMLVYGDLLSAGTEVAINIDGKNNSFRGFMCQNCYVLDAFHIY